MTTDFEKGAAILRMIRSGDTDWIAKVLRIREGEIVTPWAQELSFKPKSADEISEEDAARALEWSFAIWLTERTHTDDWLLGLLEERDRLISDAEVSFRAKVAKVLGAEPSDAQVRALVASQSIRKAEHDERAAVLGSLWGEINSERTLAQAAQIRRAQGVFGSPAARNYRDEEEKRRYMSLFRAWIEREEGKGER